MIVQKIHKVPDPVVVLVLICQLIAYICLNSVSQESIIWSGSILANVKTNGILPWVEYLLYAHHFVLVNSLMSHHQLQFYISKKKSILANPGL